MTFRVRVLLLGAIGLLAGCAGTREWIPEVRRDWRAGRYAEARDRLERLENRDAKNRHLHSLNRGVAELAVGRPREAVATLRSARDRMDRLAATDYATWFRAALRSDDELDYPGEDYEKVLVRALLAVSDLMADGEDAEAFALQVLERQLEIMESFRDRNGKFPKKAYRLVGFGSYLRAIMNEDSALTLDVAEREFRRLIELEPLYPYGEEDLQRASEGRYAPPGHGVVHVIALVGRGPIKVEVEEPVSTQAIQIAQVMLAILRGAFTLPNYQSVKIPWLAFAEDSPTEVHLSVDDVPAGETVTVTDVNETAQQQFDVLRDWIVARAILRRVFKVGLTEGAKAAVGYSTPEAAFANLGLDLLGNIWTSRERADIRCWALLPAAFQVQRIEVPAGDHRISLRAGRSGRTTGAAQEVNVRIRAGHNTYVLGIVPTTAGGPVPLTSNPLPEPAPEP